MLNDRKRSNPMIFYAFGLPFLLWVLTAIVAPKYTCELSNNLAHADLTDLGVRAFFFNLFSIGCFGWIVAGLTHDTIPFLFIGCFTFWPRKEVPKYERIIAILVLILLGWSFINHFTWKVDLIDYFLTHIN